MADTVTPPPHEAVPEDSWQQGKPSRFIANERVRPLLVPSCKGGTEPLPDERGRYPLYTDYLVTEYGDLDRDYVFVNLWDGSIGTPWR